MLQAEAEAALADTDTTQLETSTTSRILSQLALEGLVADSTEVQMATTHYSAVIPQPQAAEAEAKTSPRVAMEGLAEVLPLEQGLVGWGVRVAMEAQAAQPQAAEAEATQQLVRALEAPQEVTEELVLQTQSQELR